MTRQRLGLFSLTLFPALGLAAFAYLGNFTRPLIDDFCSIHFAQSLGLFLSIWFGYLNYSGRFGAYAADWLIPTTIFGPYRLHFFIPLAIVLWLLFLLFAIYLRLEKKH